MTLCHGRRDRAPSTSLISRLPWAFRSHTQERCKEQYVLILFYSTYRGGAESEMRDTKKKLHNAEPSLQEVPLIFHVGGLRPLRERAAGGDDGVRADARVVLSNRQPHVQLVELLRCSARCRQYTGLPEENQYIPLARDKSSLFLMFGRACL